ncbi:MAG TPA: hypothetical protein VID47_00035 [Actinomycetota bacterium]|jgi:hypothetical protein
MPEARAPKRTTDPLERIETDLAREFTDVDRRTLANVAREALARYDGAKIKDFAPVLAWRDARERLRQRRAATAG